MADSSHAFQAEGRGPPALKPHNARLRPNTRAQFRASTTASGVVGNGPEHSTIIGRSLMHSRILRHLARSLPSAVVILLASPMASPQSENEVRFKTDRKSVV